MPSPADAVYVALIAREAGGNEDAERVATSLLKLRQLKDLGPALFMDVARHSAKRFKVGAPTAAEVTFEVFYSYLLPQFEGVDDAGGKKLFEIVAPLVPDRARLRNVLVSVLGVERARLGGGNHAAVGLNTEGELGPTDLESGAGLAPDV